VHFAAQAGWVYSLALLPLAQVFAIEFTSPVWGSILAVLFLGERFNRGRLLALVAGFVGILVILRPGLDALPPAALVMLAAAAGFGVTNVLTKRLTRTDQQLWSMLVYGSGGSLLLGSLNGFAVAEAHAIDHLSEALRAVQPTPVPLGRLGKLEDHRPKADPTE